MITQTLLSNYQLLDYLGLLEPVDGLVKLPSNAVILKGDIQIPELPKSPVFTMDRLFNNVAFNKEEFETALASLPYLKHLRVLFGRFRDENGRITQAKHLWVKIKAWRIDIDVVKDEDLAKDKEEANKRIEAKLEDIRAWWEGEDKKLPLAPNMVKRSKKGWHLIYVFDEWITKDAIITYSERCKNPLINMPEDSITDQAIVFQLLTRHIPEYLGQIEPQFDEGASNNVSQIATRFITDDLPAYLVNEKPYTLREFREAFKHLLKTALRGVEDLKPIYIQNKPLTVRDVPKETYLFVKSECKALQSIDEDFENHTYNDWFIILNYYAVDYLYANNLEEAEKIRRTVHDKSSKWKGNGKKRYTHKETEDKFNNLLKNQSEKLIPPSCQHIYNYASPQHREKCLTCPHAVFDNEGNLISNFLREGLKRIDSLETIYIKGWKLKPDGWYKETRYEDENGEVEFNFVKVLPFFKISKHFFIGEEETELVEIVDNNGLSTFKPVKRNKDITVDIELIKSFGYIDHRQHRHIKDFMTEYIEKAKVERGVKIKFLGYRYVNGFWDIAVGGYGNYSRRDLGRVFYQQEDDSWFVPSVQGDIDTFKEYYYKAFNLEDPALHLLMAHYLSWIGRQFIETRSLKPELNPLLIFVGDTGTGKSLRAKIGAGLFGNPAVFSFTNLSQAGLSNRFPMIKAPFAIDEVMTKSKIDEERLISALYNIGNKTGKVNAYATHNPIDVPILLTGETQNLLVDKIFNSSQGLNRRSIVVKMTTEWRDNANHLDNILNVIHDHYGHVLYYVKSLDTKDKKLMEKEARNIFDRIELKDGSFKDIKKHLAISLATFKHFYKSFIGFNLSDETIDKKVDTVIKFVVKEMTENQLNNIGETIDYVEEVIKFISSVIKAQKGGETLKGLSFNSVIAKIDYKPSDRIGKLLKRLFWRKYSSSNNYSFRDNNLLIIYPAYTQDDIKETAEKILELSNEDFSLWLKVAEVKFGKDGVEAIKELLLKSIYGVMLDKKFPTLLSPTKTRNISQPQPEPEQEPEQEPEPDF